MGNCCQKLHQLTKLKPYQYQSEKFPIKMNRKTNNDTQKKENATLKPTRATKIQQKQMSTQCKPTPLKITRNQNLELFPAKIYGLPLQTNNKVKRLYPSPKTNRIKKTQDTNEFSRHIENSTRKRAGESLTTVKYPSGTRTKSTFFKRDFNKSICINHKRSNSSPKNQLNSRIKNQTRTGGKFKTDKNFPNRKVENQNNQNRISISAEKLELSKEKYPFTKKHHNYENFQNTISEVSSYQNEHSETHKEIKNKDHVRKVLIGNIEQNLEKLDISHIKSFANVIFYLLV